ncbi:hypothetical protein Clacol_006817 [Clathrus columnatus]|uniref:Myotubularin phosphatase domain-containing protein n=1 Tax=Clathrus columnatus TaxID=1419009 RepID=A0AAV5AHD9_9AGAM|nr:hypothetical protein Clacol_006817 [Clathrus columnatus]
MPQTLQGSNPLAFRCRNFENFSLSFSREQDALDVFESVKELTVITSVTQLYAFIYEPTSPSITSGWHLYSPKEEFTRMGVGTRTKAWRFTDINKDYTFCSTYPCQFVVPTKISDATLQYAVKHRSRGRIPALTYLHWANYGSITRSSQPMVGLTNNRSAQDEKLVEAIFQSHHNPMNPFAEAKVYGATATNLITDARPTANAMATYAKGAGTENMEYYKDAKKVYLGVDNIHAMRDSLVKVVDALREADANAAILQAMDPTRPIPSESIFLDRNALRRSGWLGYISALLEGTVIVVRNIHINSSHVLIHCSDGWDRTAQLSSLAQICLDPFFRTIKGFQILIEKDWLSFGHRFLDRCGHLSSEKFFLSANPGDGGNADAAQTFLASMQNRFTPRQHIKEISPVFHQFLESVRQIQRQFPNRFEYNQRFLERLHYHMYSCQFGTFLHNSEKERRLASDGGRPHWELTVSAWDWFNTSQEMEQNCNPDYDSSLDDPKSKDMGVLFPNPKDVRFWHELYGRSDEEMNGRVIITEVTSSVEALSLTDSLEEEPAAVSVIQSPSTPELITSELPPDADITRDSWSSLPSASPNKTERPSTTQRDSYRIYNSVKSTYSLHSNADAGPSAATPRSPRRHGSPLPRFPEALTSGGLKSMWGKLSSNASAAFLNVRDAYEGVTKDLLTGNQSTPDLTGGEIQSTDSSNLPWSLRTPRATQLEVEANPWASATQERPHSPESLSSHLPLDPNIPSTLRYNTMPSHPSTSLSRSSSSNRPSILPTLSNHTGSPKITLESESSLSIVADEPARQQADPLGMRDETQ